MGILFMQWLIFLGYGVDNTHSYYDCLENHGKDISSPHSICDGLLPNYVPKTPGIHVPNTLAESLESCDNRLFPNIYTCLHLLMVSPLSTAVVERSHSALKIVKSKMQSTMREGRLNALMMLYVHKDIKLNYNKIIDIYANKFPHSMRFSNPLEAK